MRIEERRLRRLAYVGSALAVLVFGIAALGACAEADSPRDHLSPHPTRVTTVAEFDGCVLYEVTDLRTGTVIVPRRRVFVARCPEGTGTTDGVVSVDTVRR